MKRYEVENVEAPNLYEEYFSFDQVPVMSFDDQKVEMNRPEEIWITDTTFRDGQQARAPYELDQVVELYKYLHKLGGEKGVIRQSEFFIYSERDREAVTKCLELGYKFPQITSWIRAVKTDFQLVKDLGLKETGILTSASDYHIFLKLNMDRKKVMGKYLSVVDAALEEGIVPRCHLEDITRADFYGFVIPFAQKLMDRSKESGIPIKIRACDTMGLGLPYANATLPRSVPKIFDALHREAGVPHSQLEWHGHNDFHKVLINGTTAWLYNCSSVNGTLLGWGERTGNPPIEGLIMDYIALNGGDPEKLGIDTTIITEIARYYSNVLGDKIPSNYPFVGEHFNSTRAGIHADGVIKNERIYSIFDTGKLLDRPLTVSITDKSGVAGIALWLNNYFKLDGDEALDKKHPGIRGIYNWVMEQYDNDRMSSISSDEMLTQAKKHLPSLFHSDLEGLKKKGMRLATTLIDKLMAENSAISTMDNNFVKPILIRFMTHSAFAKLIYLVDKEGNLASDYVCQPEDLDQYKSKFQPDNFSSRVWFINAINTGRTTVSDFFISRIIDELCITVSKPILDKEGNIKGVLGIDINFDNLINLSDFDM
ncbi:MAG: histone-lysine N-methyltransferase [Halanaerobiales bacterium]